MSGTSDTLGSYRAASRDDDIARATKAVTEQRIRRYPLPTSTSVVANAMFTDTTTSIRNFTSIRARFNDQTNFIGVYYDWLHRRDIDATSLLKLDDLFNHHGFKSVLVPVIYKIHDDLPNWFDRCRIVRCVEIKEHKSGTIFASDYFYHDTSIAKDQHIINISNFLSSQVFEHLKRIAHVMLSDEAAPTYDEQYGEASFGTSTYMQLESQVLGEQILACKNHNRAVELGCGTGRHTFVLAKTFKEVHGYDFSSKMIEVAELSKQRSVSSLEYPHANIGMLRFHTRDIEMFPPGEAGLDFVAGLFGMGSFVEDIDALLANCYGRLAAGGRILLSFYNKNAAVYTQQPPWRHPALAAQLDSETDELLVRLSDTVAFRIYCKAWDVATIQDKMLRYFDDIKCITLPKVAAVFPKDYPSAGSPLAEDIFKLELKALHDSEYHLGPYILVSGVKRDSEISGTFYEQASESWLLEFAAMTAGVTVVNSFFDRQAPGTNVQPILGHARLPVDGKRRSVPVAIIKPWSTKLEAEDMRDLLGSVTGRSQAFTFINRETVQQTFGEKPGDVPTGILHNRVLAVFHSALKQAPYRARVGPLVLEFNNLTTLNACIGGKRLASDAQG